MEHISDALKRAQRGVSVSVVISLIAVITLLLILIFFGKGRYFFLLVIGWWFFWLFISTLSITGLRVPEQTTYFLYVAMLLSTTFGGFFYILIVNNRQKITWPNNSNINIQHPNKLWERHFIIIAYSFVLPIVTFFFFKSIYLFFTLDTLRLYRAAAFGVLDEETSILFGSGQVQLLYYHIVSPLAFVIFILGAANYVIEKKKHLLFLGSIMLIMQAVMMLGRFVFYQIMVFSVIIFFLDIERHKKNITSLYKNVVKYKKLKFIFVVLLLVMASVPITLVRGSGAKSIDEIIYRLIIDYHTVGFVIFDNEINNYNSPLNSGHTYGRASLGSIEANIVLIIRRFDRSVKSIPAEHGSHLNKRQNVGYARGPIYMNAFSTIVYPLYSDFGVFGVIIPPFFYGFFLAKYSKKVLSLSRRVYDVALFLLLIYLGIFSIFQAVIESDFWLYIIIIFIALKIRVGSDVKKYPI